MKGNYRWKHQEIEWIILIWPWKSERWYLWPEDILNCTCNRRQLGRTPARFGTSHLNPITPASIGDDSKRHTRFATCQSSTKRLHLLAMKRNISSSLQLIWLLRTRLHPSLATLNIQQIWIQKIHHVSAIHWPGQLRYRRQLNLVIRI